MFLNEVHKERFNQLVQKAKINQGDSERKALFYILSGNDDLFLQVNKIYNFKENWICETEETEDGDRCIPGVLTSSGTKKLLNLGLQLYNSGLNKQSVMDTFSGLDSNNFKLAINAIQIRFSHFNNL